MKVLLKPVVTALVILLILNLLIFWSNLSQFNQLIAYSFVAIIALIIPAATLYKNIRPLQQAMQLVLQISADETEQKPQLQKNLDKILDQRKPELTALGQIFKILQCLITTTGSISQTSSHSAISAAEVSFSISELRKKLEIQATETNQAVQSSQQITQIGQQIADNSNEAKTFSNQASAESKHGQEVLKVAYEKISQILEHTEKAHQRIEFLSDNSDKIKDVTQVIDGIADQTNLLALNAAIEAARAGEMGRGFAVVADEVRSLAARTSEATREVGQIIDVNHKETAEVVGLFKILAEEVHQGTQYIHEIEGILDKVSEKVTDVELHISGIASNANENHRHLQQITSSIGTIDDELQQSRDHIQQLDNEAGKFTDMAEQTNASLAELAIEGLHQNVFKIAATAARDIQHCFESSIENGTISESDLFDRNHQQQVNSSPTKYTTLYDSFTDKVLPDIQEKILTDNPFLGFAITTDDAGYVPTHNNKFCQPLTGDYDKDLAGNRTKRIFNDKTGSRCGSHTEKLLLQTYKRDTGEVMHDLSVPIYVKGKHWGGFRIGYLS